ncbi:MAG: FtsW/RodA/SpoVE family cell cycle protein [Minisyncoccia bacterium]
MATKLKKADGPLQFITATLSIVGFFIFISASLGLLARGTVSITSIIVNQFFLGLVLGTIALLMLSKIKYTFWRTYALHIFVASSLLTLCVFLPVIGLSLKGATRWVSLGFITFQPSEILKYATILFSASFLAGNTKNISTSTLWALGSLGGILTLPGILLILEPDIDVLLIICASVGALFFASGMRWRDALLVVGCGLLLLSVALILKPHAYQRVTTFLNPTADVLGSGYQVHQSLIAVGSGGIFGRGFGQSVQKFGYLPEPIGDTIFAVYAEEFGFFGSLILLGLFLAFFIRGCMIAIRAPDLFGTLLALGITLLITLQSLLNISAIIALLPLSGNPLIFVSHGGTALCISLGAVGVLLNISRYTAKKY